MRRKNTVIFLAIFLCLCFVGVGYAQMSETLTISGAASANGRFDVEFASVDGDDSVVAYSTDPADANVSVEFGADKDTVDIDASCFYDVNDSVTVTLTVVNKGNVDACINSSDIYVSGMDSADDYFSVAADINDYVIAPGSTGTISIVITCTDYAVGLDFSGITVQLGYHQQTVESAPNATHGHS